MVEQRGQQGRQGGTHGEGVKRSFGYKVKRELNPLLREMQEYSEFTWEYIEDNLLVVKLNGEQIEFEHWKSAQSYFAGFLDGWHNCQKDIDSEEGAYEANNS